MAIKKIIRNLHLKFPPNLIFVEYWPDFKLEHAYSFTLDFTLKGGLF